jgi:hypothetical protein
LPSAWADQRRHPAERLERDVGEGEPIEVDVLELRLNVTAKCFKGL